MGKSLQVLNWLSMIAIGSMALKHTASLISKLLHKAWSRQTFFYLLPSFNLILSSFAFSILVSSIMKWGRRFSLRNKSSYYIPRILTKISREFTKAEWWLPWWWNTHSRNSPEQRYTLHQLISQVKHSQAQTDKAKLIQTGRGRSLKEIIPCMA